MGLYYQHGVKDVADIQRNTKGEIACGYAHRPYPGSWRTVETANKPAATRVFAETTDERLRQQTIRVQYLVLVCGQHAGTIKSHMTKGSHGFRDAREVEGLTPEDAARDPHAVMVAFAEKLNAIRVFNELQYADAVLARSREGWEKYRLEYEGVAGTATIGQMAKLTDLTDDEYGRVFVAIERSSSYGRSHQLTPNAARALAKAIIDRADEAEALTRAQVKP